MSEITYKNIEEVNGKMTFLDLKGKPYAMVPQRVKAFRMLYPQGFILTDILSHENNIVTMKAEVGYYNEDGGRVVLGTGMAFEEKGKGLVNGTSYIENCETSAVGRALGFLALGVDGGGICSAEELVNAITAQNKQSEKPAQQPAQKATQKAAGKVEMTTASIAPAPAPVQAPKPDVNTPKGYMLNEMNFMQRKLGLDAKSMSARFETMRKTLIAGGQFEDVAAKDMTMEQAKKLIELMYSEFLDAEQTA